MKRLYLLRHAKAERGAAEISDHDRSLTDRGRGDATAMGHDWHTRSLSVDMVLCSTAARARETLEMFADVATSLPAPVFDHGLYLAGSRGLARRLASLDDAVDAVLVVSHNPDIEDLVAHMLRNAGTDNAPRVRTGTLASVTIDTNVWQGFHTGPAQLDDCRGPKDLSSVH